MVRLDTSKREIALEIIKEDFPHVYDALQRNAAQNFKVGFIENGNPNVSAPVGIEVAGEVLNLSISETLAELRRARARGEGPKGSVYEVGVRQHQLRIQEFIEKNFPAAGCD